MNRRELRAVAPPLLRVAYHAAARSNYTNTHVGAGVLDADLNWLSVKYNYIADSGALVHAEEAALAAAPEGIGDVLVAPWAACLECAKAIVDSPVRWVLRHRERMAYSAGGKWADSIEAGDAWLRLHDVQIVEWSGTLGVWVQCHGTQVLL